MIATTYQTVVVIFAGKLNETKSEKNIERI